jgi:hypothetical protein
VLACVQGGPDEFDVSRHLHGDDDEVDVGMSSQAEGIGECMPRTEPVARGIQRFRRGARR